MCFLVVDPGLNTASIGLFSTGKLRSKRRSTNKPDCFAFLFAYQDAQCISSRWKIFPLLMTGIVISQARELACTEARAMWDEMKRQ